MLETRTYDPDFGELASIEHTRDGSPLLEMSFVRDGLGRITHRTEVLLGGTPVVHEYEYVAGRLVAVTHDGEPVEAYEYDLNGNRTLAEYGAVVRGATHDVQDRLESYGEWSVLHGPNGELESRLSPDGDGLITDYDPFGGLATARVEVGGVVREYLNDARGRRLETREDGALVGRWLWRSSIQPVAELDETGALVARYVYSDGGNVPDLVVTAEGERWRLVKDHLGSVRLVVDVATGDVLRAMDFDAFGRVTALSGEPDVVPFGFAGGLWDSLTGLVRLGARDYDPETGRWTAKDPIRFDGGDANLYAYVGNDPVNRIDPTGLSVASCAEAAECGHECRLNFAECWAFGIDLEECRAEEFACNENGRAGFCHDAYAPEVPEPEPPSPFEFVPPISPYDFKREYEPRPYDPAPDHKRMEADGPTDRRACLE